MTFPAVIAADGKTRITIDLDDAVIDRFMSLSEKTGKGTGARSAELSENETGGLPNCSDAPGFAFAQPGLRTFTCPSPSAACGSQLDGLESS